MSRTRFTSTLTTPINDGSIYLEDLNTTDTGHAVITKLIAGDNVTLVSSGVDEGTGEVIINVNPNGTSLSSLLAVETNNIAVSERNKMNFLDSGEVRFEITDDVSAEQINVTAVIEHVDFDKLRNKPSNLAGWGILDDVNTAITAHSSQDSLHLTSAQNTFLDAVTATATEVNHLTGVTSDVQTQFDTGASNLSTHAADASLHLTSAQNTFLDAVTATATEVNHLTGVTSDVQTQLNTGASNLNIHAIDASLHLTSAQNTFLDAVTATATEVNHLTGVTSDVQTQLNTGTSNLNTHAADASLHLTSAQNTFLDAVTVTSTEVNHLTGVTSDVQTQLNTITADLNTASTTASTNLSTHAADTTKHLTSAQNTLLDAIELAGTTADEINVVHNSSVSNADLVKLHAITASATEANYLVGVTSAIQTQLDSKALKNGQSTEDFDVDTLTVTTAILPATNSTLDIGSTTQRFRTIYVDEARLSTNTLYIGDTPILGTSNQTVNIHSDINQSIDIQTSGTGISTIQSAKAVTLSTSGQNADVFLNATGQGSNVRIGATNEVQVSAPTVFSAAVSGAALTLTGNLTVGGNLIVNGTQTTINSTTVSTKDNIIELNKGELGTGVTAGSAGLKIDRGQANAYAIIFDESDDFFKLGEQGHEETIATRPWSNTTFSLVSHNHTIDALSNVTISNKTTNDVLKWNGTSWANSVISKSEVGLGNADNTSDINKPVSTAQQTALNLKANLASPTFTGTVSGITATMVGLGNLTNDRQLVYTQALAVTGDATATSTALNTGTIALTLANSGVTAGTYNNSTTAVTPITFDAKGRATATGTAVTITPAWSSITSKPTTVSGYAITDVQSVNAWTVKTSAYTAVRGDRLLVDTSSAAVTITLPSSATLGDMIIIADYASSFTTNNVTIARNGLLILGQSQDLLLDVNDDPTTLVYSGATKGWVFGA
jgi:hypothetical protein